jgi:SAM-dependent methyltransferase
MSESPRCPICAVPSVSARLDAPDRLHGTPGKHHVARCPSCGAGVTLPHVRDENLAAFYPKDYGPYGERMSPVERLASRAIRAYQGWNALRTAPLAALRERPPGRGLDVGCGRGDLAALLARHGWTMSGIDPSPEACVAAAARGVDAHQGTVSSVALEPGSYDAVVFHHSLEHTAAPVSALRAVARALAPGGLVLITVPNFACWQARRFAGYWFHLDLPRHRVHFTPTALVRALRSADLDVLSISTSSSAVGLPASLQYLAFQRCLFPAGVGLRVASGLCALALPVARVLDRFTGGGDTLHAVARRPTSVAGAGH